MMDLQTAPQIDMERAKVHWPAPLAKIERILRETITDPVGPESTAAPARTVAA
jgi:hypothetical protein